MNRLETSDKASETTVIERETDDWLYRKTLPTVHWNDPVA